MWGGPKPQRLWTRTDDRKFNQNLRSLLVATHDTRQFSYEWQIQGLQDTENESVRRRQIEKKLQTRTLQHKAEIVHEWQGKDLEETSERGKAKWGPIGVAGVQLMQKPSTINDNL